MSVLVLITQPEEARPLVTWAARLALLRSTTLSVLCWIESPAAQEPEIVATFGKPLNEFPDLTVQRVASFHDGYGCSAVMISSVFAIPKSSP